MNKDIIVEFSGWCRISAESAKFINIENEEIICGIQWQKLPKDERSNYILEDVIDAQRDATDGSYDQIDVFEDRGIL